MKQYDMTKRTLILLVFILGMACKKPYTPDVVASPNSYLVVEGVINSGSDSTIIKLNRTEEPINNPTFGNH